MAKEKIENDQKHIIDALSIGDYKYVWEQVKYVGYQKISNIYERYLIFNSVVTKFDWNANNNFILYYKQHLGFNSASKNDTYIFPASRSVIATLKREYISPTDCDESAIAKDLRNWNNY